MSAPFDVNREKALFLNIGNEFQVRIAHDLEEACELLEVGYEYVATMGEAKLFRKRK